MLNVLHRSFAGNSRTLIIACISPAQSNYEHTISTLKFAGRARKIKNSPVRNVISSAFDAAALDEENPRLKAENRDLLSQLKEGGAIAVNHAEISEDEYEELKSENYKLNACLQSAIAELTELREEKDRSDATLTRCLTENEILQQQLKEKEEAEKRWKKINKILYGPLPTKRAVIRLKRQYQSRSKQVARKSSSLMGKFTFHTTFNRTQRKMHHQTRNAMRQIHQNRCVPLLSPMKWNNPVIRTARVDEVDRMGNVRA